MAVTENYPSKLNTPLLDHKPVLIDPVIRTPMEFGNKARRKFEVMNFKATFKVLMSGEDYKFFLSWINTKIDGGADWFGMTFRTGDVISTEEQRLLGMPKQAYIGVNQYKVEFTTEMRTNSIPDEAAFDAWLAS